MGQVSTSAKVNAADMLVLVQRRRAEEVARHNQEVAEYELSVKQVRERVKVALRAALKLAQPEKLVRKPRYEDDAMLELPSGGLHWNGDHEGPGQFDGRVFDKDIALLKLAGTSAITVRSDSNWARYL